MRGKNKIKIVLSLLIAVSFMLTSASVIGRVGNNIPTEKVNASVTSTIGTQTIAKLSNDNKLDRPTSLTRISPDGAMIPLDDGGCFPVDVTAISLDGIDRDTGDIIATGTYPLDVQVCKTEWDPCCLKWTVFDIDDSQEGWGVPARPLHPVTIAVKCDVDYVYFNFTSDGLNQGGDYEQIGDVVIWIKGDLGARTYTSTLTDPDTTKLYWGGNVIPGSQVTRTGGGLTHPVIVIKIPRNLYWADCCQYLEWRYGVYSSEDPQNYNLKGWFGDICEGDFYPATVKKFIEVFKKVVIPGTPDNQVDVYCEDFEDPCEIALNWSTIDMPVWGYNGALDTWTWSAKRYASPGHSMHSTSFDQYLPNQWDILELGFGGAGLDVSAYDSINITWQQFVEGDIQGTTLQDYGYFEYSFDDAIWTQAGINYYDSGGAWQTVLLNIPVTGPTMYFRWTWISDPMFCYEGWYIDDVCLTGIIGGTPGTTTWEFVMDSYSYPQVIEGMCETYVFNESWTAVEGEYRICAWIQALDECHFAVTEYDTPYCIYITVGDHFELSMDCSSLAITPDSPAMEGDTVNVSVDVCNVGTLDGEDVQVQLLVQRGTFAVTGSDGLEGTNNATTGLVEGRLLPGTELQWVRGTSGTYPWGTMAGNTCGYEHYTTYDQTEGAKSLANFQEVGAFPWYYHNYQSPNDYARGPLAYTLADKDNGITATVDFTLSINGPGDDLNLGIWDYGGSGQAYAYSWTGPAYMPWTQMEIPVSDWIKQLAGYATAASKYCIYVYHTKATTYPTAIDNQNPANPDNNEWSGWMLDNIVYTSLVAQPEVIFSQTNVIPDIDIGDCATVEFTWPSATVGRYVFTAQILTPDEDVSDNKCIQGYDVINTIIEPDDLECVDYTGGPSHWVVESCCGGQFWSGDLVTTQYGNNWSDALYLKNATGGLTFDLSGYPNINIEFDTWFQLSLNDFGYLQVSTNDGITWTNAGQFNGNSTDPWWGADTFGWFHYTIFVGTSSTMQFRFLFESNATGVNRGWIVDNIEVSDGGSGIIFGPDPCLNFNHFYRTAQQFGCWWNTPDQFGYTPGYGNYDPTWTIFPGLYSNNQDDALIWTLDIPHVFYGYLAGLLFNDLGVNDFCYIDVSNNGGANWTNLETLYGSPNDDYSQWPLNYSGYWSSGPWSLEDYIDDTVLIRWRMVSDAWNAHAYWGAGWEDIAFYGMEDLNPPVTTLQMSGTFDETYHYYTSAVKMKLTATDDITGVAHTYYKLDGVTSEYTGLVTINTDGDHTFCYWSVDNEGNVEAEKSVPSFRIDLTGPTVTITGPTAGLYLFGSQILPLSSGKIIFLFGGIPVTATATSTEAPILVVRFFLDDVLLAEDSTAPYAATLSAKHSGAAVIKVTARDVLEHEASATLNIDTYMKLF
jgi:hypothetical protein